MQVRSLSCIDCTDRADKFQTNQSLLHHTLNTPSSFTTFSTMSDPLSCSQALLSKIPPRTSTTWTEAFDEVLRHVLEQCRPGYVEIPTDAVHRQVSSEGLKTKPVRHLTAHRPQQASSRLPLASSPLRPTVRLNSSLTSPSYSYPRNECYLFR